MATEWRKSSFSGWEGECVETAALTPNVVGVRDSKLGDQSPVLRFSRTAYAHLIAGIKAGEFDDLT